MEWIKGDIAQITDKTHSWYPCLVIVSEVKSWGIQGCVLVPESNDGSKPVGQAYNRLEYAKIVRVGKAEITPE